MMKDLSKVSAGNSNLRPSTHPIVFVGAGPGDPELITVKGQKALMQADLIVYSGSLVPEAVLQWAGSDSEKVNSAPLHLEQIVDRLHQAWQQGRRVVRLHTGDPSLYSAMLEQVQELAKYRIPYQVIPGVTAAFAAAAGLGCVYTLPEVTQTLILTRMPGRTPVPEQEHLQSLARHRCSLAIYLSISLVEEVAAILSENYGPDALCVVACRVSQPEERFFCIPIKDLVQTVQTHQIKRQTLIMVSKTLAYAAGQSLSATSRLYAADFSHEYRG